MRKVIARKPNSTMVEKAYSGVSAMPLASGGVCMMSGPGQCPRKLFGLPDCQLRMREYVLDVQSSLYDSLSSLGDPLTTEDKGTDHRLN